MAHPKHQSVRQMFNYCCGYCGVSEVDSGGELTVDHYQPVSSDGDDSDDNLVYACWRCNLNKGSFWPDAAEAAIGLRLLHPLLDDLTQHIRENENGHLEALTNTGRVHITMLQLNRPPLVANRLRAEEFQRRKTQDLLLMTTIHLQARTIREQKIYRSDLGTGKPDEAQSDAADE